MFYGILLVIHIIACLGLIVIVLLQSGRGGGLSESFSSAESIFGTKTNIFLTRTTMIFAVVFLLTCLALAFLSKQSSKSIMPGQKLFQQPQEHKDAKDNKQTLETTPAQKIDTKIPSNAAEKDTQDEQPVSQPEQKQAADAKTTQKAQPAK